mmetsp:Transcript_6468/g.15865  ORF Transcript_6468/g.15865 Transcript_6468/m.15865 type:complete len:86 (+) Transcript_6468:740-997(+)
MPCTGWSIGHSWRFANKARHGTIRDALLSSMCMGLCWSSWCQSAHMVTEQIQSICDLRVCEEPVHACSQRSVLSPKRGSNILRLL